MNPKLEKASWIAAIVSAIVAVYTIFGSPQFGHKETQLTTHDNENKAQQKINSDSALLIHKIKQTSEISFPPSCQDNTHLLESINTAQSIYDSNERDSAYVSLVFDALCADKFDVALDTVSKIQDSTIRDNCRFCSVEFLIHKDNYDYANRFAEKIYDSTVRDKAKRVIIEEVRSLPAIPKELLGK